MTRFQNTGRRGERWILLEGAAARLRRAGCDVDLTIGYSGWPSREAARSGRLTEEMIHDATMVATSIERRV